jgi:hypothetical protein
MYAGCMWDFRSFVGNERREANDPDIEIIRL